MTEDEVVDLVKSAQSPNHTAEQVWIAGLCIACVGLRRMDSEFSRERKLRNVERELRDDLTGIAAIEAKKHVSG